VTGRCGNLGFRSEATSSSQSVGPDLIPVQFLGDSCAFPNAVSERDGDGRDGGPKEFQSPPGVKLWPRPACHRPEVNLIPRFAAAVAAAALALALAPVSPAHAGKRFGTQLSMWESELQACKVANDDRTGFRIFIRVDNTGAKRADKAIGGIAVLRGGKETKRAKTDWTPGGTISDVVHVFVKNKPNRTLELHLARETSGSGNIISISDVRNC